MGGDYSKHTPTEWISIKQHATGTEKTRLATEAAEQFVRLNPRWKFTGKIKNMRSFFKDNDH